MAELRHDEVRTRFVKSQGSPSVEEDEGDAGAGRTSHWRIGGDVGGRSVRAVGAVLVAVLIAAPFAWSAWSANSTPQTSGPGVHVVDMRAGNRLNPPTRQTQEARTREGLGPLDPQVLCMPASAEPVVDGRPIVVSLPPGPQFTVGSLPTAWWTSPPEANATWRLWFWSLRWAQPVALRAHQDGAKASLRAVVTQALQFYRAVPDTGKADVGWAEGEAQRRLQTLNCLYALTKDSRIPPRMAQDVRVQGDKRYYGPPFKPANNHGLMANMRMMVAGLLTNKEEWVAKGRQRIVAEADAAFSRTGMSTEQSAGYHFVIADMWREASTLLSTVDAEDEQSRRVADLVARADAVSPWLTEPDGTVVQVGDTENVPAGPLPAGLTPGLFRDDDVGVLAARWSWTDPQASYFTARYGPEKEPHGHYDKSSVTWSQAGTRILVDPGYLSYDPRAPANPWHWSPQAHNVAMPTRGKLNKQATGSLVSATFGPTLRAELTDTMFARKHERSVALTPAEGTLVVSDRVVGAPGVVQHWHLDASWQRVDSRSLEFRHASGRVLTVSSTGTVGAMRRGSLTPFAGWQFPTFHSEVPAWQFEVRGVGSSLRTTFVVR